MRTTMYFYATLFLIISAPLSAQWVQTNGPYGGVVNCFAVNGTNLFAGTGGADVFLSTNNGTSWNAVNSGLTNSYINTIAISSNGTGSTNLFAGTSGGVFLSTNNGTSWSAVNTGLTNTYIHSLAGSGTNLFAGTSGGVFLSTNNGTSWSAVNTGMIPTWVKSIAISGTNLFAGIYDGGVYLSTNNGTSWSAVNTGLTYSYILSLTVSGTNLFAGTYYGGVWRRSISEMVTAVKDFGSATPTSFSLSQNYPNPFNPSTVIRYGLPSNALVSLKVYDVLGREIESLVNERQSAGIHSVTFHATKLQSGVYFYRIQAGTFQDTKKLLLLK